MNKLGQYIISLCAAGILCSILLSITFRQESHKKMIAFLCGISMMITALSPWITFRFDEILTFTSNLQAESSEAVNRGEVYAKETLNHIILQRTEAYILDKAVDLGLDITVTVELSKEEIGKPYRIYIQGAAAPLARSRLIDYISNTLGIAKENQIWT